MKKIKTFITTKDATNIVNRWIEDNPEINIIDIKFSLTVEQASEYEGTIGKWLEGVMIFYEEKDE